MNKSRGFIPRLLFLLHKQYYLHLSEKKYCLCHDRFLCAVKESGQKADCEPKPELFCLVAKATKGKTWSAVDGEQPSRNPQADASFIKHCNYSTFRRDNSLRSDKSRPVVVS